MADTEQSNLTHLTIDLLSAYVANNTVEHQDLAGLIQSTHAALKNIDSPEPPAPEEPEHKPAVSLRKSLGSKSHIISMVDGKPYQTLKRHLSKHGLTPDQYRERYGLPKTYPMVAPAYSESRRAIAEKLGLGRKVQGAQKSKITPAARGEVAPDVGTPAPSVSKKARIVKSPAAAKAAVATAGAGKPNTAKSKAPASGAKPVRAARNKAADTAIAVANPANATGKPAASGRKPAAAKTATRRPAKPAIK